MEIVYSNSFNHKFREGIVNNFYGDIKDLTKLGINIEGIIYDDKWTVKRFLGVLKNKKRIKSILNYLDIDETVLNKKISELSKTDFKWVLLAYLLINNCKYIIFEYFDTSLIYKDKKKFVNVVRKLISDGINIIVISKDLELMNQLNKNILVVSEPGEINECSIIDLVSDIHPIVEVPEIITFIKLANKKKANLAITLDSKELLKDIYRGVK